MRKYVVAVLAMAVLGSPAVAVPAVAGTPEAVTAVALEGDRDGAKQEGEQRTNKAVQRARYRVEPGVTFNHPFRPKKRFAITKEMLGAIRHAPRRSKIRVMSWNFAAGSLRKALIDAHQRGVSVRVIMSRQLAKAQGPNGDWNILRRALDRGDNNRPAHLRSWARTCSFTCRGRGGSMHSKLMVIDQTGASRYVVMQGSANLTNAAAVNQWNDWYTTVGNEKVYRSYMEMFKQAEKDRRFPTMNFTSGNIWGWFAPRAMKKDVPLRLLNQVRCKGAVNSGINGRTSIRVASAVFQNDRGKRLARRLKELHRQGCNVRVVFTMMTNEIRDVLRGAPVRQLVYDYNRDGAFDDYLHMKSMAISGHVGSDRSHHVVFNGSANWSTMGQISDEQGMVIRSRAKERQYGRWISELFNNAPRTIRPTPEYYRTRGLQNPYAGLELELD